MWVKVAVNAECKSIVMWWKHEHFSLENLQWPDLWMCHWSSTAEGRKKKRKHWLWTTVSKATLMWWSVQRIQQSLWTKKLQKYIWSVDQLPLCWAFSDMLFKLVRLRLQDQFSPVDIKKSVAFTSISYTLTTHINGHTDKHVIAFINQTYSYTPHM